MTKIEELVEKSSIFLEYENDKFSIYKIMEEYAEYYAKKCLEIANSQFEPDMSSTGTGWVGDLLPTDIKLPEHE